MTLYLTDRTDPAEIDRGAAKRSGCKACKLYPAGATTNSDSGVTDIRRIDDVLARMSEAGMPLLVHGEVTARHVDVFDRETRFIDEVLAPTLARFPKLRVVFEHITTARAVEFVNGARDGVARHDHAAAPAAQPQRDLRRRHPPALLLPAHSQDRTGPRGPAGGRDQRQSALLPRHRQRAARAAHQGKRLRLRRHVLRARGHRAVRRSLRSRSGKLDDWKDSRPTSARISTACRAIPTRIRLARRDWTAAG